MAKAALVTVVNIIRAPLTCGDERMPGQCRFRGSFPARRNANKKTMLDQK
ncbi:hypothetical protein [Streptomyces sp. NPDC005970]